jgi:hypothetical protein
MTEKDTRFAGCTTVLGRPRLGGIAGRADAGKYAAFSLSVDTVSILSPICSLKKRRERSNTL